MKNILQLTKAIILTLAAVIMLLNTNVLTAQAGTIMFPGMIKTEDGKIRVINGYITLTTDSTGRKWAVSDNGYPFCMYKDEIEVTFRGETEIVMVDFLDCYLTDIIRTYDESEWPSFVIKGSDNVPFYYCSSSQYTDGTHYAKFCYDEKSGWWIEDKAYKGPNIYSNTMEEVVEETKTKIENGETINGTPANPAPKLDIAVDSDDVPVGTEVGKEPTNPTEPEEPEIKDPYEDINTLGATLTLKTDCIKVKKNNAPQKPLPKSVKIGKKALKRNKTFTVSYEKYTDDWHAVDAVTDAGIYRLVITGKNGYEGVCTKRLYVTAEKTIKAMSSVSVKVNKVAYTGKPVTSGVIKTAKIGKRTLTDGVEYSVTYINNTDSGIGQVILTAKDGSGLLGTKTVNFTITGNKMSKVKVSGIDNLTYSPGIDLVQDMSKVKLTYNGTPLNKDTDFTVSYVNNAKAGTAKIVFTGKGLYNGTLTKTFKINKATLSDSMLDETSKNIEMTYTGKALQPDVTLKNGDTELKKGTDYTLTYKNNKKVSTDAAPAQIIVKGKGSYTGSFKVDFAIVAKSNGADEKSNAKIIKPDADESKEEEPVTDEPTTEEPVSNEPIEDESTTDGEVSDETADDENATDDENTADDENVSDDENTSDETAGSTDTENTDEANITDTNNTTDDTETSDTTEDTTEDTTDEPTDDDDEEATDDDLTANEYSIADIDTETTSTVETTVQ